MRDDDDDDDDDEYCPVCSRRKYHRRVRESSGVLEAVGVQRVGRIKGLEEEIKEGRKFKFWG